MIELYERLLEPLRKEFDTPHDFLVCAVEYFRWATEHPNLEEVVAIDAKTARITRTDKKHKRVFTKEGMISFLNLPTSFFSTYRKRGEEWEEAITRVELIIKDDKYTNAVSGLYNANLIARDLGLSEKTELTGKDGGPVQTLTIDAEKLSTEALAQFMDAIDESEADSDQG